jgi:hypothetical protein
MLNDVRNTLEKGLLEGPGETGTRERRASNPVLLKSDLTTCLKVGYDPLADWAFDLSSTPQVRIGQ